jgi:hypothetical protein
MTDDVKLKKVRVGIEDMMKRNEFCPGNTGLERLWRSRRWRMMTSWTLKRRRKTEQCHGRRSKSEEDRPGEWSRRSEGAWTVKGSTG